MSPVGGTSLGRAPVHLAQDVDAVRLVIGGRFRRRGTFDWLPTRSSGMSQDVLVALQTARVPRHADMQATIRQVAAVCADRRIVDLELRVLRDRCGHVGWPLSSAVADATERALVAGPGWSCQGVEATWSEPEIRLYSLEGVLRFELTGLVVQGAEVVWPEQVARIISMRLGWMW